MEIEVNNRQHRLAIDASRLVAAVQMVLAEAGIARGEVSIAVVDDSQMRRLNAEYLGHDWPTDVLSFVLESDSGRLDGQIVVSAAAASRTGPQFGWTAADELLLYAIHGALHLVGYDDRTDADRRRMRQAEQRHLAALGVEQASKSVRGMAPHPDTADLGARAAAPEATGDLP